MTFLPVVHRELIVASRRKQTYWHRAIASVLGVSLCVVVMLIYWRQPAHTQGQVLFSTLLGLDLFLAAISGLGTSSDSLVEEKREGTLGLLFLTDLRGLDIVLGKLVASSLRAFYSLLAVIPVLSFAILLGGVTLGEFGRAALLLLIVQWQSLCVGMLASAISPNERLALTSTLVVQLALTCGVPVAAWYLSSKGWWSAGWDWVYLFSPFASSGTLWSGPFARNPAAYLGGILLPLMLGAGCLWASCLAIRLGWRNSEGASGHSTARRLWVQFSLGEPEARLRWRRRLLGQNPILWLGLRNRTKVWGVWIFIGVSALLWLAGWAEHGDSWAETELFCGTILIIAGLLKIWMVAEGCSAVFESKSLGALELLLTTPLTVAAYLRGHFKALRAQFGAAWLVMLVVGLVFLVAGLLELRTSHHRLVYVVGMFCIGVVTLVDLVLLPWVALWAGLHERRHSRAVLGIVAKVIAAPFLLFLLGMALLLALETTGLMRPLSWLDRNGSMELVLPLVWMSLNLLVMLLAGLPARQRVLHRFREEVASTPAGAGGGVSPKPGPLSQA